MKSLTNWTLILILLFAIFGTLSLVKVEFIQGDICPKILAIPACYIVLVCFIAGLLSHTIKSKFSNLLFFLFIGLVTMVALIGSTGEVLEITHCPRTSNGIPMCFISLGICISLLGIKILKQKIAE